MAAGTGEGGTQPVRRSNQGRRAQPTTPGGQSGWRPDANDPAKPDTEPAIVRERRTLDSPQYIPVLLILIVMAVGSVGAFFVLPPLLDRIDRVGKVGIFGF
jgi:hypothetical protein